MDTDLHPMFAKPAKAEAPSVHQEESTPTVPSDKHALALSHLEVAGPFGLTYPELGEKENWGHGQVSSILSNLHRDGLAVRLYEKRQSRCSVYVLPKYAEGRKGAEFKGNKASQAIKDASLKDQRILELEKELEVWKTRNNSTSHGDLALQSEVDRLKATNELLSKALREADEKRVEDVALVDDMNAKINQYDHLFAGYGIEMYETDQILGKVLGYPEAFPHVSEIDDGSVVTGEHTLPSLAAEAADKIVELRNLLKTKEEIPAPKIPTINPEEAQFLDKVKRAIHGKPDTAVQPTRAGSLRSLVGLVERMPRA
jgi:hypothetical protein